ncbi:hypothetical protein I545_2497 [Mycobacterium kansasii 662]|uniref:Uncharacterized protein n=2 Tax=Mycobacterium kansasii TaxID=1768 RepID=A0A1V3XPP1_MYCKA|nr:hypothetical protein I547_4413 [Mycobacterium kansasii 824]EUA18883.1 hypothetical protein I545_2497 [Mycobacterium kansasii 662]KEP39111.1 hypothetical protein MKSMC1_57510 [Mycobacterium kansasii]OOK81102.1 hypothetical protein BZL29_1670 [Mycobacterium kansasii]
MAGVGAHQLIRPRLPTVGHCLPVVVAIGKSLGEPIKRIIVCPRH